MTTRSKQWYTKASRLPKRRLNASIAIPPSFLLSNDKKIEQMAGGINKILASGQLVEEVRMATEPPAAITFRDLVVRQKAHRFVLAVYALTARFPKSETYGLSLQIRSATGKQILYGAGTMRFLHTADWQIGMKAAALGAAGELVREERLAAGKRVVEVAKTHGADFILVAGDLFEDNAVSRVLVQKVADILDQWGGPVLIIPGNHDPLVPGSVWEHPAWKSTSNVRVLRDEMPVDVPGGILYPCAAREKHSGRNPTAWIPPERKDAIRIGLAHGTVEGIRQDEPDYPIPRDAAQRGCLDYLALGHWHSYATYPCPDGAVYMAYSGTHETTKFGERDSGNVLIVDISGAGAPPTVTPVRTGGLTWTTIEKELREQGDLTRVKEQVEALPNPGTTLVELYVLGLLYAGERAELNHIEDILASRFVSGRLDASRLRPSPEDDSWLSGLPPGVVREAADRLRRMAVAEGESSEKASRALIELYAIAKEVTQ